MPRKRKATRPFRRPDGLTAGEQADLIIEMTLAGKRLYHDWRRGGRKNDLTQSQRA